MRRIGTLPGESQAYRFCDYLQTQAIEASAGSSNDELPPKEAPHDIWIRHEKDVEPARELLGEFQINPRASQYDVSEEAERLRRIQSEENEKKIARQKKNRVQFGNASSGGRGGLVGPTQSAAPITIAVIVFATIIGFATSFGNPKPSRNPEKLSTEETIYTALSVVDVVQYHEAGRQDPLMSIKEGQLWRLITPMFLHGSTMHLAFNMINLFILGGVVERIHGKWFYVALLLVCQAVATLTQVLLPDWLEPPLAIGASGAVFGVFGFVWIRPKIEPNYPVSIPPFNVKLLLGFLVLCMTPIIPGIANGAHVGGLLAGMIMAAVIPHRS